MLKLPSYFYFGKKPALTICLTIMENIVKNEICFRKLGGITFEVNDEVTSERESLAVIHEIMRMGFNPTEELVEKLKHLSVADTINMHGQIIPMLASAIGMHHNWVPMYPNFPKQVAEASIITLHINALRHYFTSGKWTPDYPKNIRPYFNEDVKGKELGFVTESEYLSVFEQILASNDSISEFDKTALVWFLDNEPVMAPEEIPYKENACIVGAYSLEKKRNDLHLYVKTSTDVLRLATFVSGGDISLARNSKFIVPKRYHKQLVSVLDAVISEEDIKRHENKWNKLFHCLHVGTYPWAKNVNRIAKKVRNGENLYSPNSDIEFFIGHKDTHKAVNILKKRPGEFARRIDKVLRETRAPERKEIIAEFLSVADQVSTRVLMQVLGAIKTRNAGNSDEILVLPKGKVQKAVTVKRDIKRISKADLKLLSDGISKILRTRFSELDKLGNVYIEDGLKKIPLPSQQRSASQALKTLPRGSHVPFDSDKETIRLFCYWVGQDIDLSATFHDESFKTIQQISYTNLRSNHFKAYHSGDIVNGENGACEFIDIDIESALSGGARYVGLNLYVYSGPNFSDHKVCYTGWMERDKPNSGEIFEPKTVSNKIDMTFDGRACIPVFFDLKEREVVWVDMSSKGKTGRPYNIHTYTATIEDVAKNFTSIVDNQVTLYDLFELHGKGRGSIITNPAKADVIFGVNEGTVTAQDITVINGEYLK